ncbi:MAG: caspase family protein [Geminicoccaceae bacterium]
MTKRISFEDLNRMLADPDIEESDLRPFIELDEARSGPMAPALKLNEDRVEVPKEADAEARAAVLVASFNFVSRNRRQADFHRRRGRGYNGPTIVSEGDSWFQYPILLDDVIDHLLVDYPIMSLGAAGDTLQRMFKRDEFTRDVERYDADILLLSGAGNDLLAGGDLSRHLRPFDSTLSPAAHLLPTFDGMVDVAVQTYDQIFRQLEQRFPGLAVICHGYDRPIPRKKGKWLGKPMISQGIKDTAYQQGIAAEMIDRFNAALTAAAIPFANVTYIDARGVVTDSRWHDELHPTDGGYGDVAALFKDAIEAAAPARPRGTPMIVAAGNGASGRRSAPSLIASKRQGLSLHIGLNAVDPDHYAGWDGALDACEFDAEDMAAIAEEMGYKSKVLLTKDGKRDTVVKEIGKAAKKLKSGDIFWVSFSAHGGQVTDMNGDERDGIDETWCLYDAQLIDDELYMLWSQFAEGVRILVLSDSCHSGTVLRRREPDAGVSDPDAAKPRFMPRRVATRTYRRNRDFYEKIGRSLDFADGDILNKELITPLACSVRLISGCQDNQFSMDGFDNGRFTGALRRIWAEGAFDGDYKRFHDEITQIMPSEQTPNYWHVGRTNPAFDSQRPFEI